MQKNILFSIIFVLVVLLLIFVLLVSGVWDPSWNPFSPKIKIGTDEEIEIKFRDTKIRVNLGKMYFAMAYVKAEGGNFDDFNCDHSYVQVHCNAVQEWSGNKAIIIKDAFVNSQSVCVYAKLYEKENYWYCVDSSGKSDSTSIDPQGVGYCVDGKSAVCPPSERLTRTREEAENTQEKDSVIVSALSQSRVIMAYLRAIEGNLDNFHCEKDDDVQVLCKDIRIIGASNLIINKDASVDSESACVYAKLHEKENYWYCVDSFGNNGFTKIDPSGNGYCIEGESTVCPRINNK